MTHWGFLEGAALFPWESEGAGRLDRGHRRQLVGVGMGASFPRPEHTGSTSPFASYLFEPEYRAT